LVNILYFIFYILLIILFIFINNKDSHDDLGGTPSIEFPDLVKTNLIKGIMSSEIGII
jgi:hypothetical protein